MTRKKIYIYPTSSKERKDVLFNPYIDDLIHAFSRYFTFVNEYKPAGIGVLDILKYSGRFNLIFFHWIEKIPGHKFGKLQTALLFLLMPVLKLSGVKIIWTMHNKLSHLNEGKSLTQSIFRLMLKRSDLIITHASEGISFGESMVKGSSRKIIYLPHPVKDRRKSNSKPREYDILIWGTISPYKGVDKFLEYLNATGYDGNHKILIVGKSTSDEYFEKIAKYASDNVVIQNRFISDTELPDLIDKSRHVLFTYSGPSILSSGVLMDSLGYGANIIGPHVGAFADLAEQNIIRTFRDFKELSAILANKSDNSLESSSKATEEFLKENTWDKFAEQVARRFMEL